MFGVCSHQLLLLNAMPAGGVRGRDERKYMFSQVIFGVKWRSVLSHFTGGSLREKALDDRR